MHLTVGDTVIPYTLRESTKANRKRIIVSLTDDELIYLNPSTSSGTSVRAIWKRAH